MKKIKLTDIFTTTSRSDRTPNDRFTTRGITNTYMASATLNTTLRSSRVENRVISTAPYRILDAPCVIDDFYLNILDWHLNNIFIALSCIVYQYNTTTKKVSQIYDAGNVEVASVKACDDLLCIGLSDGRVLILKDGTLHGFFSVDTTRVGCIDIIKNTISVGTKKGTLAHYNIRTKKVTAICDAHNGEICSIKWSPDQLQVATGGNDNTVKVWRVGHTLPRMCLQAHKGAVKAMAWCPWRLSILCTGGGSKDGLLKEWDVTNGICEAEVSVKSQVCTLHYSEKFKEIISSHGYVENNIIVWKSGSFKKVSEFGKHDGRVLNTAMNLNGSEIVSVGADENLKFWKLYEEVCEGSKRGSFSFR